MDRETIRNMWTFISKIKFEKIGHLVGFITKKSSVSLPLAIKNYVSDKQEASCGPGVVCTSCGEEKNHKAVSGIKNILPGCQSVA
jgi:hypothetical protein